MVVGPEDELDKMRLVLGVEGSDIPMDINTSVASSGCRGHTRGPSPARRSLELRVWERYGIVITRLRREGLRE